MTEQKTGLRPLNVSARLHEKTKIIAALSRKGISEIADEIYLPIAERREAALIAEAAKNGKAAAK
jgi:hypothetical protein